MEQRRAAGQKYGQRNRIYAAGLLCLAVLAAVHFLDVRDGITESGDTWLYAGYGLVVFWAAAVTFLLGLQLLKKNVRLETVFLTAALGYGLLYLTVLPPLCAPDETRHYISAYELSNRILGVSADDPQGRVPVRTEDWFAEDSSGAYVTARDENGVLYVQEDGADGAKVLGQTLTEETYRLLHGYTRGYRNAALAGGEPQTEGLAFSVHAPVQTTPCAYLAPALGITLARLLNLNTLCLLFMGRICNLLLFTALVYAALRRMPFGRGVLFGAAVLPMTLHLAASYSYDTLLLGGFFLFTAVSLDLAYARPAVRPRDILILAVIMGTAGPLKMVYAVLVGLCLLIPLKKFGGRLRWFLAAFCVLGAWALVMILVNRTVVASYATGAENYIAWAEEPGYSLAELIHRPLHTFRLFFRTVIWQAETWHLTMIGAYLGQVDLVLDVPYLLVAALSAGLVLLAFRAPGECGHFKPGQRLWIWILCAACAGGTMFSMLLAWTPVSSDIICGVQGRYFLPFLPVFLLTLENGTIVLTKDCRRSILYLMCCANAYVLMRIFSIVCRRL